MSANTNHSFSDLAIFYAGLRFCVLNSKLKLRTVHMMRACNACQYTSQSPHLHLIAQQAGLKLRQRVEEEAEVTHSHHRGQPLLIHVPRFLNEAPPYVVV